VIDLTPKEGRIRAVKHGVLLLTGMMVILGLLAAPASADFTVAFPDETAGLEINEGFGLHLAAVIASDLNISAFAANATGNPLFLPAVAGGPAAFAFWLSFQGFNVFGESVYDVYANQGFGFFFVTRIAF
jgi:hypothetical protein